MVKVDGGGALYELFTFIALVEIVPLGAVPRS